MTYRTHCDWCGGWLGHEADQAVMSIAIYHREGKSKLQARWAEEAGVTRHFCAAPREDVDETGTNRMGLVPEEQLDTCYDRAIAAITGTELRDPGIGMEWRLMEVEQASKPAGGPAGRLEVRDEAEAKWKRMPRERRESLLFDALGQERLLIRELTDRINTSLGYPPCPEGEYRVRAVYGTEVGNLIKRLFRDGQLGRQSETFNKTHTRYRYFRNAKVEPVADDRRLAEGEKA